MRNVSSLKGMHSLRTRNKTKKRSVPGVETSVYLDLYMLNKEKERLLKEDVKICIGDVELLDIKIRLIVASVDKAMQMGINWWQTDSYLSSEARQTQIEKENKTLKERL